MTALAMVLDEPGTPLVARERPAPELGAHDVLIAVEACGICRTDLHILDGELRDAKRPVVPGHQIEDRPQIGFRSARASACPGSPARAAAASTARAVARTSATLRGSPATTATAASPG
jgi:hypothetical protein